MWAVLLTLALALTPPFENRTAGHQLRTLPGWHAYVRDRVTIVSSDPIERPQAMPGQIRVPYRGVYIWLDQYRTKVYAGEERPRPARFRSLPPERGYDCGFGEGHALLWREGGFHFHAFVRLGPRASESAALAILNSLRITK